MRFQVPQFIETEDRIVGPFSLKQFIYIVISGGICMSLFFFVTTWLWVILSIPIMGSGLALGLVKINGQPLTKIALAAAGYYWKPQTYVWQPEHPALPKTESNIASLTPGISIESIIRGISLKSAWQNAQTGTRESSEKRERALVFSKERYEVFGALSGERRAAKRVDY